MKPVDIVVLLIVVMLCIVLLLPAVHSVLSRASMSNENVEIIGDLLTSMIAIVSIYVGAKLRGDGE